MTDSDKHRSIPSRNDAEKSIKLFDGDGPPRIGVSQTGESVSLAIQSESGTGDYPSINSLEPFSSYIRSIGGELADISAQHTGSKRAFELGHKLLQIVRNGPIKSAEELFNIITIEHISVREAMVFTSFADVYATQARSGEEISYPRDVPPLAVAALAKRYSSNGTVRSIVDKLRSHPADIERNTAVVLTELSHPLVGVESVVTKVAEKDVDDVVSSVQQLCIMLQREPPTEKDIIRMGPDGDRHLIAGDESVNQSLAGADAGNRNEIAEVTDALERAVETEEVENNEVWTIGRILIESKNKYGLNYTEMLEEANIQYTSQEAVYARRIAEVFEYGQYPTDVSPLLLYRAITAFEDDTAAQKALVRVSNADIPITTAGVEMWRDMSEQSLSNMINAVESAGVRTPITTVKILCLFANRDLPEEDVLELLLSYPDISPAELTEVPSSELDMALTTLYSYIVENYESHMKTWRLGELVHVSSTAIDYSHQEVSSSTGMAQAEQQYALAVYNMYDKGEWPEGISPTLLKRLLDGFENNAHAKTAIKRCEKLDHQLTDSHMNVIEDIERVQLPELALTIADHDFDNPVAATKYVLCLAGKEIPSTEILTTAVHQSRQCPTVVPDEYASDNQTNTESTMTPQSSPPETETDVQAEAVQNAQESLTDLLYDCGYTTQLAENSSVRLTRQPTQVLHAPDGVYDSFIREYSPSLPSEQVVRYLTQYDELTVLTTDTGYWTELLTGTNVEVTGVNPAPKHFEPRYSEHVNDSTVHKLQSVPDTPVFIPNPQFTQDIVANSVLTYAAAGGGTILYLGELPPVASDGCEPFLQELTDGFMYTTTIEGVRWEETATGLHVFLGSSSG